MNKILLLLEDYSELTFIQILLKKLGFDVDAIQNPHAMADRLMVFRPNVVIAPEDGKRIRREMIAPQLSNMPAIWQILLSANAQGHGQIEDHVFRIKSPIQPTDLINALAVACHMDATNLTEKYQKFRRQMQSEKMDGMPIDDLNLDSDAINSDMMVSGGAISEETRSVEGWPTAPKSSVLVDGGTGQKSFEKMPTEEQESFRKKQYAEFLKKSKDSVNAIFSPKDVAKETRDLRAHKNESENGSQDIDIERQEFTKKLFAKKTNLK